MTTRGQSFVAIDHVQLAMPPNQEQLARDFYARLLGMHEISKPSKLAKRGGCWFQSGVVQIHLGVEQDFHPARKGHPALKCADYDGLLAILLKAEIKVAEAEDIPDIRRCHISDPFGNRIELIDCGSAASDE